MLEEIVDKTDLTLGGLNHGRFDFNSMSPFPPKQNKPSSGVSVRNNLPMAAVSGAATEINSFPRDPEHAWTTMTSHGVNMDFAYETMVGDEDPERWLNELLSENVLGLDSMAPWGELMDSSLALE